MLEQHGSTLSTRSSRLARLARQSRTCRVVSSRAKWNLGHIKHEQTQLRATLKAYSHIVIYSRANTVNSTGTVCVSGWKRSNNNAEGQHSNLTQSII